MGSIKWFEDGNREFAAGNYSRAALAYQSAINGGANSFEAYNALGQAFLKLKDYEQGINNFSEALELNPKCGPAYAGRAICYFHKKDFSEACEDCLKAKELGQEVVSAHLFRNKLHSMDVGGKWLAMIYVCSYLLTLDPKDITAYRYRARAYRVTNQIEKAAIDSKIYKSLSQK